ncbi:MAG TPA: hypothetical protein VF142_22630 [Longimicrobium sp.]
MFDKKNHDVTISLAVTFYYEGTQRLNQTGGYRRVTENNADLDARFEEILKGRAQRLNQSIEEVRANARNEPRSARALRTLAASRGEPPGVLLERAINKALNSDYPTPLCLQPGDLGAYIDRVGIAPEVLAHVPTCAGCSALVEMIKKAPPALPAAPSREPNPLGKVLEAALQAEYSTAGR